MSYCLNPSCPDPEFQRTPNPKQARFCSNCGSKLLLSDRYRALQLLGQGNMGRTFLGVDEHKPSRPRCVIKQTVLAAQSEDDLAASSTLFHEEAVRLETLGKHPQIPALLAHFEHDQLQYLIQEYIDGDTLDMVVAQHGPLQEDQIRYLLNEILPVLQFVHIHQIIHRDIKPQNLICRSLSSTTAKDAEQLYLVDFGAAKFATVSNLLLDGTQIGSQDYAPPEQIRGRATFSSDLYSLGATCLYLLTLQSPLRLFDFEENRWNWRSHLQPPISDGLVQVLDRLVARPLSERYKTANEALEDLQQHGTRVSDRPTFIPQSVRPPQAATATPTHAQPTWRCINTLTGHNAWVRSVAVDATGQIVVSGSGDKTVKIWSAETGKLLHDLVGHTTWVRAVAISPDGQRLASVSNDKTVRLWHTQSGQECAVLKGHTDWIRAVTFTPNGNRLFTAGQDKNICVWDVHHAKLAHTFTGHQHWVLAIAISPNGHLLASGSRDRTIRLWNLVTGTCQQVLEGHAAEVAALAFSPDGQTLVSSSSDQTIKVWNITSGDLHQEVIAHASAINGLAISADGLLLATASSDKTIKLWDLNTLQALETLTGHIGWVWTVAFPSQATGDRPLLLASGSWDGAIKLWKRSPIPTPALSP
ncbi:MAG: serine/threonine-protein kinase [Synechococcales bacterium]|nr:serine/threonine-protein kinase [Synechococcales bacterium]